MGCENISARVAQSAVGKRLITLVHKSPGAFQNQECSMSFIKMTYLWIYSQCFKYFPAANAKHHFLQQAVFTVGFIQPSGYTSIRGAV